MVKQMAVKVLQQREHGEELDKWRNVVLPTLGTHWISRFLDRYPHLASKFSTQVKKQRIMNSDPKILKHAFEVLRSLIRAIQPHNIYNMDEKGLQMGKSAQVKVICARGRRSPPIVIMS